MRFLIWIAAMAPAVLGAQNDGFVSLTPKKDVGEHWVVVGTPQQFGDLIRKESVRLGQVVKAAGVTLD